MFIVRFFMGLLRPKYTILGSEFSGTVDAVGTGVQEFKTGDEVFGLSADRFGAHAAYLCLPEKEAIALKPANYAHEEATALLEGPYLALNYFDAIPHKPGQRILIYGASGSIGSSAVQLARHYGLYVTAVCDTANLACVRSLGPDKLIDYTQEDFTAHEHGTYDYVFDAVGKTSYFRCRKLLKPSGQFFATDFGPFKSNIYLTLWFLLKGSRRVIFPLPKHNKAQIDWFRQLAEAGELRPVIDSTYLLADIVAAHHYVATERKTGSVVIRVIDQE
jgi:NADPH:quinone reductase-like Zn-dependent oxidoreductase